MYVCPFLERGRKKKIRQGTKKRLRVTFWHMFVFTQNPSPLLIGRIKGSSIPKIDRLDGQMGGWVGGKGDKVLNHSISKPL